MLIHIEIQLGIMALLTTVVIRKTLNPPLGMIHVCYRSPANSDIQFDVKYPNNLSFLPSKLYVELEMDKPPASNKESYKKTWKVQRVSEECHNSGFILPLVAPVTEQNYRLVLFSDDTKRYKIEVFELKLSGSPVDEYFPIQGLNKIANILMKISSDSKWLKYTGDEYMKYFGDKGQMDVSKYMCLTVFKRGEPIIISIPGHHLQWGPISDQYLVDVTLNVLNHKTEFNRVWFATAVLCDTSPNPTHTKIYIADDKDFMNRYMKLRIFFDDTLGTRYLTQYLTKTIDSKDFKISSLNATIQEQIFDLKTVSAATALSKDDGLMMYETVVEKRLCNTDGTSYVEVHKVGDVIVEKRGHIINDDLQRKYHVAIVSPGTDAELNQCLI